MALSLFRWAVEVGFLLNAWSFCCNSSSLVARCYLNHSFGLTFLGNSGLALNRAFPRRLDPSSYQVHIAWNYEDGGGSIACFPAIVLLGFPQAPDLREPLTLVWTIGKSTICLEIYVSQKRSHGNESVCRLRAAGPSSFFLGLDFRASEAFVFLYCLKLNLWRWVRVLPRSPIVPGAPWRTAGMHFEQFHTALNRHPGMGSCFLNTRIFKNPRALLIVCTSATLRGPYCLELISWGWVLVPCCLQALGLGLGPRARLRFSKHDFHQVQCSSLPIWSRAGIGLYIQWAWYSLIIFHEAWTSLHSCSEAWVCCLWSKLHVQQTICVQQAVYSTSSKPACRVVAYFLVCWDTTLVGLGCSVLKYKSGIAV